MAISLEEALQAKAAFDQQELEDRTPLMIGLPAATAEIVGADVAGKGRRFAGGLIGAIWVELLGQYSGRKPQKVQKQLRDFSPN